MDWLAVEQAAACLRCSELTIRRRIEDGALQTKWEDDRLLVAVEMEMPGDKVAEQARRLSDVSGAMVLQRQRDAELVSGVLSTTNRMTDLYSDAISKAEEQVKSARRVGRRA